MRLLLLIRLVHLMRVLMILRNLLLIAKGLLLIAARSPESLYEVASTLHPETVVFQHTHTPEPSVPYSNVSGTATAIDTASGTRSGGW